MNNNYRVEYNSAVDESFVIEYTDHARYLELCEEEAEGRIQILSQISC